MSRNLQQKRPLWKREFDERRIETEMDAARKPPRWHRYWRVATWGIIAGGAYLLLFRTSWGGEEEEHAFSSLQRLGTNLAARFFQVDDEVAPIPPPPSSEAPASPQSQDGDKQ
jgi:hypothetical protein